MVCVTVPLVAKGVPVGDVQAMRRLAEQLAAMGREVAKAGEQVHGRATDLEFQGPAGRRLRTWATQQKAEAARTGAELDSLSKYLQMKANELQLAKATPKG